MNRTAVFVKNTDQEYTEKFGRGKASQIVTGF